MIFVQVVEDFLFLSSAKNAIEKHLNIWIYKKLCKCLQQQFDLWSAKKEKTIFAIDICVSRMKERLRIFLHFYGNKNIETKTFFFLSLTYIHSLTHAHALTHTHFIVTSVIHSLSLCVCVCVRVRVSVWKREREWKKESFVCVCKFRKAVVRVNCECVFTCLIVCWRILNIIPMMEKKNVFNYYFLKNIVFVLF